MARPGAPLHDDLSAAVKGILVNPIYTGVGPFPRPEFIGQGLGKYFLRWAIDKAWSYNPRRFWLHTCTKDHPAALPNYLEAGFAICKEEAKDQG